MTKGLQTSDANTDFDTLVSTVADKLDAFSETLEPSEAALLARAFADAGERDDEPEVEGLVMHPSRFSDRFRRSIAIRPGGLVTINPQPLPPTDTRFNGMDINGQGGPIAR